MNDQNSLYAVVNVLLALANIVYATMLRRRAKRFKSSVGYDYNTPMDIRGAIASQFLIWLEEKHYDSIEGKWFFKKDKLVTITRDQLIKEFTEDMREKLKKANPPLPSPK